MVLNYLRIAFRNLKKDKISSIINIVGLAVGITCFLLLVLFILDDLSYDKDYPNADRLYRAYVKLKLGENESIGSKTCGPLGPTLLRDFPEVETYARMGYFGNQIFKYKDKSFREWSIYWVDSTFFEIFQLEFLSGDPKTALTKPNTIVITEETAKKYFGNEDPIGKTIISDQKGGYLVSGVIKAFPLKSHFRCEMLASISTYPIVDEPIWLESWYTTYLLLKEGTDPKQLEEKISKVTGDYIGADVQTAIGVPFEEVMKNGNEYKYLLQPFDEIYLYSGEYGIDPNTEWGSIKSSDITYTYAFSAIAVFILLLAIINFMNLATARSERRAKEVGIRKTLGSSKSKLALQFFVESIFMSSLAIIISLALLELVLPLFNEFVNRDLQLSLFENIYSLPMLIGFILFIGILAGSYPALYLSSFQPAHVLKTYSANLSGKSSFRNILVVIQFSISIIMLIGTLIIRDQLEYIQNKGLGFNKENLLIIWKPGLEGFLNNKIEELKTEFLKHSKVINVANSSRLFESGISGHGYIFNQRTGSEPLGMQFIGADYDFINTYKIELLKGRFFSKDFPTDTSAVIVNEAALKVFGTDDVIDKDLYQIRSYGEEKSYKIIGVVKDFNYESLHREVRPLVINLKQSGSSASILTVRIQPEDINTTIEYLKSTWNRFSGGEGFHYSFLTDHLATLYDFEKKTSSIASVFSGLAIFIACLGLFGLAAYVTERRTKEIGIRKVLGASITEIVILLSKEFAVWVLIANIIAWPVAYYVMQNWLEDFAFRITINFGVFILAGLSALTIALITVSMHALKAALANPVDSLRNE